MPVLFKKNKQSLLDNSITDDPPVEDLSTRKIYADNASAQAPFLSNWVNNPVTIQKMQDQFYSKYPNSAGKAASNVTKRISNMPIFDMSKLASLPANQYATALEDYNAFSKNKYAQVSPSIQNKSSNAYMFNMFKAKGAAGLGYRGTSSDSYNGIGTIYDVNNPDQYGTATHELTHRSGLQDVAEKYIFDKWGAKQLPVSKVRSMGYKESDDQLNYLRDIGLKNGSSGEGVYPRIMQLRKILNLTPGTPVTQEMLNSIDGNSQESPLRGLRANWDDNTILEILNNVAANKPKTNNNLMWS